MTEIECIARKWGNSLGIIIPKEIVVEERLLEHEKLLIEIKKKHLAKEFFGLLSGWERPTDKIKEEMKKGW